MTPNVTRLRLLDGMRGVNAKLTEEEIKSICRELFYARNKISDAKQKLDEMIAKNKKR